MHIFAYSLRSQFVGKQVGRLVGGTDDTPPSPAQWTAATASSMRLCIECKHFSLMNLPSHVFLNIPASLSTASVAGARVAPERAPLTRALLEGRELSADVILLTCGISYRRTRYTSMNQRQSLFHCAEMGNQLTLTGISHI